MPPVQITGVEVTQAIQYFGSTFPLCGPSSARVHCDDNSLPLVEGKRTIFRVYVDGGTPGGTVNGIMDYGYGALRIATPIPTPPIPPNRANRDHTLIFEIPENAAKDAVPIRMYVWDSTTSPLIPSKPWQTQFTVAFQPRALIKLRLVRIHYVGHGMDVPPPTTADFWRLTQFVQNTFPVPPPGIELVANTVEKYDGDFTSILLEDPSNIGTTGTIFNILENLLKAESLPPDVLYAAIYSSKGSRAIPDAGSLGRVFMTPVSPLPIHNRSDQETFAHELGHSLGRKHAPCDTEEPPNVDPKYPSYGLLRPSSIGEVGIDVYSKSVYDPVTASDFMSYCHPQWISPYTYLELFTKIGPPPSPHRYGGSGKRSALDLNIPQIMLWLTKRLDRYVIVDLPTFVLPRPVLPHNEEGDFHVELQDQNGIMLVQRSFDAVPMFDAMPMEPSPNALSIPIVPVAIPWTDEAARLVVSHYTEIILEHQIEPTSPRLEIDLHIGKGVLVGEIDLRWQAESTYGKTAVLVRYSPDKGDNWIGIPIPHRAQELTINLDALPGGEECLIEVFASSGIRTTSVRSHSFSVTRKPAIPLIIRPLHGARVRLGEPVELFGVFQTTVADPRSLIWFSDIDGQLGVGSRLVVEELSAGRHKIELRGTSRDERSSRINLVVEPK